MENSQKELRLLVPLDGSPTAESVLPVVVTLAQQSHAKVMLLHVIERGAPSQIHGERHLRKKEEAELYLQTLSSSLWTSGVSCEMHVHPNEVGDVAMSILEHAREMSPDIIVMCSHGWGGLRDVFSGNIAQQVIREGFWPLLLVPARSPSMVQQYNVQNILIPIDPSHAYEESLESALLFASLFSALLHLLCVTPEREDLKGAESLPGRYLMRSTSAILDMEHENVKNLLIGIKQRSEALGAIVSVATERGDVGEKILEYIERSNIDLLVMSSHGRSGIQALISRSTTPRLMAHASCPMLIIRIPED